MADPFLDRRTILIGALGAGGAVALGGPAPRRRPAPVEMPAGRDVPTYDLTVRWRHLEPRVDRTGPWTALLAGWLFDEGIGYAFGDVSGGEVTLYLTGSGWNTTDSGLAGSVHRAGLRGRAVALDGSRWLAAAPTKALAADGRGLTVTAWVWLDGAPSRPARIVGEGSLLWLGLRADGRADWTVTTAAGRSLVATSASAVPTRTWTHVAATMNPAAGTLDLFVGGVPSGHVNAGGAFALPSQPEVSLVLGRDLAGLLDQVTIHRAALDKATLDQVRLLGLPRTFTQTSESVDDSRALLTHYKGSEPVPHPTVADTAMSLRFATTLTSEQGQHPTNTLQPVFAPVEFGCGWRAMGEAAVYAAPVTGSAGTFEAWYRPAVNAADPGRLRAADVFTASASTSKAAVRLSTRDGRWRLDLTTPSGRLMPPALGPVQTFSPSALAHVAVAWGVDGGGALGVHLFLDGRPAAFVAAEAGGTTFDGTLSLGGTASAPAYCILEDVRVSSDLLGWGAVCPRGQASTEAAGLDLRDFFQRPPDTAPLWWGPGAGQGAPWLVTSRAWQYPERVGDDPGASLAVWQPVAAGVHSLYHPDAFGIACSIEAGVSVPGVVDGWAGLFILSGGQGVAFSGITFMLNPSRNQLRLAQYLDGQVVAQSQKSLPHEATLTAKTLYEMTLTTSGDGVVRGFVDHSNVISIRRSGSWPTQGLAGLVTDGTQAAFSAVHFTALTPATVDSRTIETRTIAYGVGASNAGVDLVPFQWRKRRGLLPWEYTSENPEPAGNIAGADAPDPPRPIPPAHWRSEDSANSDLIVVDGTVWYFMRGNPHIDNWYDQARVGVLHAADTDFDGVHFADPNEKTQLIRGGGLLLTANGLGPPTTSGTRSAGLNEPATAYVGNGTLLFLGRASTIVADVFRYETAYARFDLKAGRWVSDTVSKTDWSDLLAGRQYLHGSPEIVALRDPDTDDYQCVVLQQLGGDGSARLAVAMVEGVATGVPHLAPGLPIISSISRANMGAIYGFRVMFDNGIYYLHYNEGPVVPDWPDRFVLAAALNPYSAAWVVNEDSTRDDSTYFHRGTTYEPDNGAIWQGTMVKLRGHYYLYYENYHSTGDVNLPYAGYGSVQAGSRVGFATA